MAIQSRQVQDVVVVIPEAPDLKGLADKMEWAISTGQKKFLLNLSRIPRLFGDGVEDLTAAQFKCEMGDAVLAFCCMSADVMTLLESLGLDTFFPYIFEDEPTGLRDLIGAGVAREEVPMTLEEVRTHYQQQQAQAPPQHQPAVPPVSWAPKMRQDAPGAVAPLQPAPAWRAPPAPSLPPPDMRMPPAELPSAEPLEETPKRRKFKTGRFRVADAEAIQTELKKKLENVDFDNLKLLRTSTEFRAWSGGDKVAEDDSFRAFVVSAFHSPKHLDVFEYLCLKTERPNQALTLKELKQVLGDHPLIDAAAEGLTEVGILACVKKKWLFLSTPAYRLAPQQPNPARINRLIVMLKDDSQRKLLHQWIKSGGK